MVGEQRWKNWLGQLRSADWYRRNLSHRWVGVIGTTEPLEVRLLLTGRPILVQDIQSGSASGDPQFLTRAGDTVFFSADDGIHGRELWKTDGTAAGTVLVKDINPGSGSGAPFFFTALNNDFPLIVFQANDGLNGSELWRSDGTTAGTVPIKDIYPGATSSNPQQFAAVDGKVYFLAQEPSTGYEPWVTNGTLAGTLQLANIAVGTTDSSASGFTQAGGTVFFSARDSANGTELWRTDGTPGGTSLVKDIRPGANSSFPADLTEVDNELVFVAEDSVSGRELWTSDGTASGTQLVKDIASGATSSNPAYLTDLFGTSALFSAVNGSGRELWLTDGTPDGTSQVQDINFGPGSSNPGSFFPVLDLGAILFRANDGSHGAELWQLDSLLGGTQVRDINPGAAGSYPTGFAQVGKTIFFAASTAAQGRELWQTDGTKAGTILVRDVVAGATGSYPLGMLNLNGTLIYAAETPASGRELYAIPPTHVTIGNATVVEGNSGTRSLDFRVTLDRPTATPLTLYYNTFNGTATAGSDYIASSGSITFARGESSKTISIAVNGDTTVERDEILNVVVFDELPQGRPFDPHGAPVAGDGFDEPNVIFDRDLGVGKIINDDSVSLFIGNGSVTEGDTGTTVLNIPVRLPRPVDTTVSVDFTTADYTATVADGDYTATSGTLVFTPGTTVRFVQVTVKGDRTGEKDELVQVRLSGLSVAPGRAVSLGRANGIGQIRNDDPVTVSIGDASIVEGPAGATRYLRFDVTLSQAVDAAVAVTFTTANGTALAGSDYVAQSGRINFAKGATLRSIFIAITGDNTPEPNETLFVTLTGIAPAGRDVRFATNRGMGLILNDDGAASLRLDGLFGSGLADALV